MKAGDRTSAPLPARPRRSRWTAWLAAAGVVAGGAGFSAGAVAQTPSTVRIVLQSQLRILDPVLTVAYSTRNHGYLIYDTLFSMDANSVPQPQMVETYTVSPDKLNYSFTLRPGLKFHDGTPVTSEDVIASLNRWSSRGQMGVRLFAALQEMKAVDAATFTIRLKSPFGLVLETLAQQSSPVPFIMPARIAAAPPSKAITEFIGSGPYKFVPADFQPAVKATYLKFADYVPRKEAPSAFAGAKVALADRLELVSIPDPQTAVQALRVGEIDYIEDVPPDLMSQLEGVKGITLKPFGANSEMLTLRMNWLHPPFDNVKVRRAALAAINQVDYLDAQFGNPKIYQLCGAALSCVSPYATEQYATQIKKPDLAKARALLKESGYDGSKVVILHPTDITVLSSLASITAQALRSIGMNVEIQSMDYTTMQSRRTKKDPIAQGGWSIVHSQWSTLDLLTPIINPNLDGRGEVGYIGWSKSDVMEKLRDAFAAESDMARKKQIAVEVQKLNYDEVFYIPLGGFTKIEAYNDKMARMVDAPLPLFWKGKP